MSVYCIDTSALIHGWQRDYPPDVFFGLWDNLVQLASLGNLFAPDEVLLELERGADELNEWAKAQNGMFLPPDEDVQQGVSLIVNQWPEFVPENSRDGVWADPYVIALARAKSATVVTGERTVGPGAKRPKIPNICNELTIPHTTLLGLIRSEKWSFQPTAGI